VFSYAGNRAGHLVHHRVLLPGVVFRVSFPLSRRFGSLQIHHQTFLHNWLAFGALYLHVSVPLLNPELCLSDLIVITASVTVLCLGGTGQVSVEISLWSSIKIGQFA